MPKYIQAEEYDGEHQFYLVVVVILVWTYFVSILFKGENEHLKAHLLRLMFVGLTDNPASYEGSISSLR